MHHVRGVLLEQADILEDHANASPQLTTPSNSGMSGAKGNERPSARYLYLIEFKWNISIPSVCCHVPAIMRMLSSVDFRLADAGSFGNGSIASFV